MTIFLTANNAGTTLAGSINSTATTAALAPGTGALFPNPSAGQQFALTLVDALTGLTNEIVYVTGIAGDTITTMLRGQEGTTPRSWLAGDLAGNFATSGSMATTFGNPSNVFFVAPATASQHALQLGQATGRLLNRYEYYLISGVPNVSINGGAPTTTGATTYTPNSLMTHARARVQGAGGGGAGTGFSGSTQSSAGTGGCAGGYVEAWLSAAQIGASAAITVGAGGTGGIASSPSTGGTGGTSSVAALASCTGGQGGVCNGQLSGSYITAGTVGGSVTLGGGVIARISAQGNPGGPAIAVAFNVVVSGSGGSAGISGAGAAQGVTVSGSGGISNGRAGSAGAGGSGGCCFNSASAGGAGGAGGDGLIVIEEYA